jgi:hypothetical protein
MHGVFLGCTACNPLSIPQYQIAQRHKKTASRRKRLRITSIKIDQLAIVIEREFMGMRTQTHRDDFIAQLVLNPGGD